MSMSSRPVSLQAALMLRRAQVARERAETVVVLAPRSARFALGRIFGASSAEIAGTEEIEPRKLAA